jgi:hypothetical protein
MDKWLKVVSWGGKISYLARRVILYRYDPLLSQNTTLDYLAYVARWSLPSFKVLFSKKIKIKVKVATWVMVVSSCVLTWHCIISEWYILYYHPITIMLCWSGIANLLLNLFFNKSRSKGWIDNVILV